MCLQFIGMSGYLMITTVLTSFCLDKGKNKKSVYQSVHLLRQLFTKYWLQGHPPYIGSKTPLIEAWGIFKTIFLFIIFIILLLT